MWARGGRQVVGAAEHACQGSRSEHVALFDAAF